MTVDLPIVTPDDPRYDGLTRTGNNRRFTAHPEVFRVAGSTQDVVDAVQEAVTAGKRIAVRSGGHGFENVVGDPQVQVVIDLGEMRGIYLDPQRNAIAVEPGARMADIYRTLYHRWGVALPAGDSAKVGLGGHVPGGGYGSLTRSHGLAVDHLEAVEVVVVDADGTARAVVASRDPHDEHYDLWWAHTGGGGGNFGIATRYWFRSPGAEGTDPSRLLPHPPAQVLSSTVLFPRPALDESGLRTLVGNFGRWHERNSTPGDDTDALFGGLVLLGQPAEMGVVAFTHVDAALPEADKLLQGYLDELLAGVGGSPIVLPVDTLSWLDAKRALAEAQDGPTGRQKVKSSFSKKAFTDEQISVLYAYLNSTEHANTSSLVAIQSYGGRANAVAADATAVPHRDAVLQTVFMNFWDDPQHDEQNVGWSRRLYRDVYASTGGVPTPDDTNAGAFISFSDVDLADPAWNTSGVAWTELYYRDNFARLQSVKAEYDPRAVFRHTLGVPGQ